MNIAFYIIAGMAGLILLLLLMAVLKTALTKKKSTHMEYSEDEKRLQEYAEKLSKMVQFETVSTREDPRTERFNEYHELLAKLFPNVFSKCEVNNIDGNLAILWKGENRALQPIALMSHQDVVPAEGKWKYEPFSGEIAEGKVWGRGTGDTKCSAMAFYMAVEELMAKNYTPKCDVYLLSSCTEEIGGDGGPKIASFLKERNVRLFMLCDEGGSIVENPIGGVKGNFAAIGIFEKGYGDVKFTAKSNGGHASAPSKNTPLPRLAKLVAAVERKSPFRSAFSPAVDAMFRNLAPYCENFGLKLIMCNLWLFKPIVKKLMPAISAQAAAMLRTTIAFTMAKGSDGYNVLPQEAYVTANLRFIPHEGTEESLKILDEMAKKYDVEMEVLKAGKPSSSLDLNGEQFAMTEETVHKVFPGIGIMPYVVTGATDCRFYEEVTDAAVRFSPVNYGPEQLASMHGIDENIEVGCLPGAVDYYKELIIAQEKRKK